MKIIGAFEDTKIVLFTCIILLDISLFYFLIDIRFYFNWQNFSTKQIIGKVFTDFNQMIGDILIKSYPNPSQNGKESILEEGEKRL